MMLDGYPPIIELQDSEWHGLRRGFGAVEDFLATCEIVFLAPWRVAAVCS